MYEVFEALLTRFKIDAATFCKQAGISQSTISNWKTRGNLISVDHGIKIASFFNVTLDYLYTGRESNATKPTRMNDREREILLSIRNLNEEGVEQVRAYIDERARLGYIKSDAAPMVQGA